MKHKLGLVIVILVVLFNLTPAKDQTTSATSLANPNYDFLDNTFAKNE